MPQYECAVVLVPTLTDEQVQEHTEMIKTWITGLGAQVAAIDVWGRKRLAFPIRKQQEGVYIVYYFTFDQDRARLADFSRRANTTETILRHLVVRLPALKEPPRLPAEEEVEEEEGREREGGGPEAEKREPEGVETKLPVEGDVQMPPASEPPPSEPPASEPPPTGEIPSAPAP